MHMAGRVQKIQGLRRIKKGLSINFFDSIEKKSDEVRGSVSKVYIGQTSSAEKNHAATIWHRRMAYASPRVITDIMRVRSYRMTKGKEMVKQVCDTCFKTKQVMSPAMEFSANMAEKLTIHIDSCGSFQTQTIGGKRYFYGMATTPHRYAKVWQLKLKNEMGQNRQDYIAWLERIFGARVKRVQADNDGKFLPLRAALRRFGITFSTLSPCTPASNEFADRLNRTL